MSNTKTPVTLTVCCDDSAMMTLTETNSAGKVTVIVEPTEDTTAVYRTAAQRGIDLALAGLLVDYIDVVGPLPDVPLGFHIG